MRIGLVDVDGHRFPNLALMKLSAYHKKNGDFVEWANSLEPYDKVYMAKVFTFSRDDVQAYQTEQLIRGVQATIYQANCRRRQSGNSPIIRSMGSPTQPTAF